MRPSLVRSLSRMTAHGERSQFPSGSLAEPAGVRHAKAHEMIRVFLSGLMGIVIFAIIAIIASPGPPQVCGG